VFDLPLEKTKMGDMAPLKNSREEVRCRRGRAESVGNGKKGAARGIPLKKPCTDREKREEGTKIMRGRGTLGRPQV